jgi:hypothetical protein
MINILLPWYNGNIVESGIKHHKPIQPKYFIDFKEMCIYNYHK